jgi:hypothetical protein
MFDRAENHAVAPNEMRQPPMRRYKTINTRDNIRRTESPVKGISKLPRFQRVAEPNSDSVLTEEKTSRGDSANVRSSGIFHEE